MVVLRASRRRPDDDVHDEWEGHTCLTPSLYFLYFLVSMSIYILPSGSDERTVC